MSKPPVEIVLALCPSGSWSASIPGVAGAHDGATAAEAVAALKRAYAGQNLERLIAESLKAGLTAADVADMRDVPRRVAEAGWSVVHETRKVRDRAHAAAFARGDGTLRAFRADGWTVTKEAGRPG